MVLASCVSYVSTSLSLSLSLSYAMFSTGLVITVSCLIFICWKETQVLMKMMMIVVVVVVVVVRERKVYLAKLKWR